MKYTTKVKQKQLIGTVEIDPKGGDLKKEQVDIITADPYGKDLIKKGFLTIEGVKAEDLDKKPAKKAAPAPDKGGGGGGKE